MSRFPRPGRTPRPRPVPTAGPTPSPTPTPSPIGNTFTLTTNIDTIPGLVGSNGTTSTAGDDRVVALFGGTATGFGQSTLNPGDNLDLGTGVNSLDLTIVGPGTASSTTYAGFITRNIQNYNISNFGTVASVLAFSAPPTGIQNVNLVGSNETGDTSLGGITSIVGASMLNGAGDLTLGYTAAAVAGSTDVQNLVVNNLTGGAFTAGSIETLNITSAGLPSTKVVLPDTTNTFATVNISGGAALGIDIQDASVRTVNGATATGALTLDVADVANAASSTDKATVTGGSANDEFILESKLDADVVVNGNAGVNTLTLTGGLTAANATGVSNIQAIKAVDNVASGGSALSVSYDLNAVASAAVFNSAVTSDAASNQVTATITNFNNTDRLVISNGNSKANTIVQSTDTTSNVLDAAIDGVIVLNLTANDAETVNIASNLNPTSSTTKNKIDGIASFTDATSVVVTGSNELTIDRLDLSEPSNGLTVSYNSSAFSGKSTVVFGTGGNQNITTGSNNDSIALKASTLDGFDNINLGGGTNTLIAQINSALGILNITNAQEVAFGIAGNSSAFLGNNTALTKLTVDVGTGSSNTAAISGIANNTAVTATLAGTSASTSQTGKLTFQYQPGSTVGSLILEGTGTTAGTNTRTFSDVQVNNVSTLNLSTSGAIAPALTAFTGDALLTTLNINSAAAVSLSNSSSTANLATINGSQSTGPLTVGTGVVRTSTASLTGGSGNDNFGLNVNTQSLNSINAGSGTDTLTLAGNGNAAVTVVNLASTTDQLVSINGQINTAVQVGFENLNASSLSNPNGFGVNVDAGTGTTNLVGSVQADTLTGITGGSITYTPGAGNDVVTFGNLSDTVIFAANAAANGLDTISTFTTGATASGGDIVDFGAFVGGVPSSGTVADKVANTPTSSGVFAAIAAATSGVTSPVAADDKVAIIKASSATLFDTATEVASLFGSAASLTLSASENAVVLIGINDGTAISAWYVANDANGTVSASEVTQVGNFTTNADAVDLFATANFQFTAV
jgi:hypothetical protein